MLNDETPESVPTLPQAVEEVVNPSPFHPRNLFDLFFRPRRFFTNLPLMQHANYLYLAAWLYGMVSVMDRMDQTLSNFNSNQQSVAIELVGHNWPTFWLVVVLLGLFSALLTWIISGFWFWLRICWSGHDEPDGLVARQVFFYSGLIWGLPAILWNIILTFAYPDYVTAYGISPLPGYGETSPLVDLISVLLIIFPFWSVIASYIGVRTCFSTVKWKAMLWFAVLPLTLYVIGIVMLVAMLVFM